MKEQLMVHRRLSEREGRRPPRPIPYEGVPDHLQKPLARWLYESLEYKETVSQVMVLTLDIAVVGRNTDREGLLAVAQSDPEEMLDALDLAVKMNVGNHGHLDGLLALGGSVWTVGDGRLERRVSQGERGSFEAATAVDDQVTAELNEAWGKTFGRSPDPSDAWDHSIRALEALLIPRIVPSQTKANLGHVAGQLKNNPGKYDVGLTANAGWEAGQALEGMLRLIWPNPDRHPTGEQRTPTLREAEKVVLLTVTIVNLCRDLQ